MPHLLRLLRRPLGLAVATAVLATPALAGGAALAAPTTPTSRPARANHLPAYTATAKAHRLGAGGAIMGWRHKVVRPVRTVSASPSLSSGAATGSRPAGQGLARGTATPTSPLGVDVSAYSGAFDWASFITSGVRFAYVKDTEGTYYHSNWFTTQTTGAKRSGVLVGAYHFANPRNSSGTTQADWFIAQGGGFTPGTATLPGALDIEWDPYTSNMCYGLTQAQMYTWISAFQTEYKAKTGIYPVVYTARPWWNTCVGTGLNSAVIAARSPLWVANYTTTPGPMPSGWMNQAIWQTGSINTGGYDTDTYNGGINQLRALSLVGTGGH